MKNYLVIIFLGFVINSCIAQNDEKLLIKGKEVSVFDSGSEFFYETIKTRLIALDTTLTPKHLLAYTWYIQKTASFNPSDLDLKAKNIYKLNEEKQYRDAVMKCRELLAISPNNITGFKEMGFAYKRLGKEDSVQICFTLMVKAIEGAKLSGDGDVKSPYVLNNSFELISLIEATTGLYADKSLVIKDSNGRILVLGIVQSPRMGRFALIDHWSKYLKDGEFVTDEDLDKQEEEDEKMIKEEIERLEKEMND